MYIWELNIPTIFSGWSSDNLAIAEIEMIGRDTQGHNKCCHLKRVLVEARWIKVDPSQYASERLTYH